MVIVTIIDHTHLPNTSVDGWNRLVIIVIVTLINFL